MDHVGAQSITLTSLADGKQHALERGDRMLGRLDLAYALNVHTAQGVTTDQGIVMMSAREGALASQSTFLVAVTRIADKATLVADSGRDLERTVLRNPGEKTAALDVAKRNPGKELTLDEPSGGRRRDFDMSM